MDKEEAEEVIDAEDSFLLPSTPLNIVEILRMVAARPFRQVN